MEHVVTRATDPFVTADGALTIHQVPAWTDNLIWLLVCNETGATAAVDGPCAGPALDYCAAHGLPLSAVFNTHTHPDHIGLNLDLRRRGLLETMRVVGAEARQAEIPGITQTVREGDIITVGAATGRVMQTEGHLDGHISFVFSDAVFCGDTMFAGGCGYLFDGPPAKMHDSLSRLAALPGDTRVCCAHEYTQDNLRFAWSVDAGNAALAARIGRVWHLRSQGRATVPSTVAQERATNPFLRHGVDALIARVRAACPDRDLSTPVLVFAALRALKDRGHYKSCGDEGLPL